MPISTLHKSSLILFLSRLGRRRQVRGRDNCPQPACGPTDETTSKQAILAPACTRSSRAVGYGSPHEAGCIEAVPDSVQPTAPLGTKLMDGETLNMMELQLDGKRESKSSLQSLFEQTLSMSRHRVVGFRTPACALFGL